MISLDELKENVSILEAIEGYTSLFKSSQSEYKGICPIHDGDTLPSLYVNPTKGLWKCFGCDLGGDVISFIQEVEGLDFKDAVEFLGEGQQIQFKSTNSELETSVSLFDLPKNKKKEYELDEDILKEYTRYTHEYLLKQGFDKEILDFFQVGYCYNPSDVLYNRITFPWRCEEGRLVAISGRDTTEKKDCKYKALKGSKKIDYLYNLNNAKYYTNDGLIICEDEKSVIKLWQWGYKNVVALGNKDLSNRKWLLRKYTDTAILCFDNDERGREGRNKAIQELKILINIEVIKILGEYKDAAEIRTKEEFDKFYKNRDKLNI